jgi:myotubularin-related protein 1/2
VLGGHIGATLVPNNKPRVAPLGPVPVSSDVTPLRSLYSSQAYTPTAHLPIPGISASTVAGIAPIQSRVSILPTGADAAAAAAATAAATVGDASGAFFSDDGTIDIRAAEHALEQRRQPAAAAAAAAGASEAAAAPGGVIASAGGVSGLLQYPIALSAAPESPPFALFPVAPEVLAYFADDSEGAAAVPDEQKLLHLHHVHYVALGSGRETRGDLIATTYQLAFVPYREQPPVARGAPPTHPLNRTVSIPLASVEAWVVDKKNARPVSRAGDAALYVDVVGKDVRHIRLGFEHPNDAQSATTTILFYMHPKQVKFLFPLCLKTPQPPVPAHLDGWRVFDPVAEYARMGLPNANFAVGPINTKYGLCDTYPEVLCLPSETHMRATDLWASARFRSRKRLPALSWKNPHGYQTIWRCSQPCIGIAASRCAEDERLLELVTQCNKWARFTTIFDARPRMNAMGNQIAGKGVESEGKYTTCKVRFMDIHNIHAVRESYKKLWRAALYARGDVQFFTEVGQSGWFAHIASILTAVHQMVTCIDQDRASCVTHCSDGWDRTSQLSALTKLCVDPSYRTTRGFIVLIEHDWLSFGHKFHERLGHGVRELHDQRSPVFIQFLDCVYQLMRQFPRHFEFTAEFLAQVAVHSYSCRFGTFLFNSEMERRRENIAARTPSLWTYLLASPQAVAGHLTNAMFAPGGRGEAADVNEEWPLPLPFGSCRAHVDPAPPVAPAPAPSDSEDEAAEMPRADAVATTVETTPADADTPAETAAAAGQAPVSADASPAPEATESGPEPEPAPAPAPAAVAGTKLILDVGAAPTEAPAAAAEDATAAAEAPSSNSVASAAAEEGSAAAESSVAGGSTAEDDGQHLMSVEGPNGFAGLMTPPPGTLSDKPIPLAAAVPAADAAAPAPAQTPIEAPAAAASVVTAPTAPATAPELFPRLPGDGYEQPLVRGTVLYPSSSARAMSLWSEYWMRFQKDEATLAPVGPGVVFPSGGATGTTLLDARARMANAHLHWARSVAAEAKAEVLGAQQELVRAKALAASKDEEIERLRAALTAAGLQA